MPQILPKKKCRFKRFFFFFLWEKDIIELVINCTHIKKKGQIILSVLVLLDSWTWFGTNNFRLGRCISIIRKCFPIDVPTIGWVNFFFLFCLFLRNIMFTNHNIFTIFLQQKSYLSCGFILELIIIYPLRFVVKILYMYHFFFFFFFFF